MKKQEYVDAWSDLKETLIQKYLAENDEVKKNCLEEVILEFENREGSKQFQNLLYDIQSFSKS